MKRNWIDLFTPLYDAPGDSAGGGADMGGGGSTSAGGSDAPAEPTVIDLPDENALIRVPGMDKPVKYGEHVRGFQREHTKAAQRAAQLERELAAERQRREQYERERQSAAQRPSGDAGGDVFAALEQLPYLDGAQAAQLARGIAGEISRRDQVLRAALTKMQQMEQVVNGLHSNHSSVAFDAKINKFLGDLGYGPELADIAKEVYLAYEGDDLDTEFPDIFRSRVEQMQKWVDAQRQAAVNRNRQRFVPGRGGQAGPGKPITFKGDESPQSMAEQLWNDLHPDRT
jgi:hypothetical protein